MSTKKQDTTPQEDSRLPLSTVNYKLLLLGFVIILLGFVLMAGGGSDSPTTEFSYEMFSFRRITLAPILVVVGFVVEIYAILKR